MLQQWCLKPDIIHSTFRDPFPLLPSPPLLNEERKEKERKKKEGVVPKRSYGPGIRVIFQREEGWEGESEGGRKDSRKYSRQHLAVESKQVQIDPGSSPFKPKHGYV